MLRLLRKLVPDRHPIRLLYHRMLAFVAAVINGFPGNKMIVIGVTGTNGKSTTVNMITNVLNQAGHKVGMTSTINFQVGNRRWTNDSKQTTQGPFYLQKLLKEMADAGCKYAVVEVTSHAITQARVWGINFDIAVVTNVTSDHVEYHGDFNSYLNAKGGLFRMVSGGRRKFGVAKVLIMNADDKYYNYFDQFVADRKLTYGLHSATIYAAELKKKPEGSHFIMHVPNNAVPIELNMPGEFNVYNALSAAAVCLSLQVPLDAIKQGLEKGASVAGRYERVDAGQKFNVIVDYAHTPDALASLFNLYKRLTTGKLFVVFGATGGGRDKGKRAEMGRIADELADYVIVANDDPYEEDELEIIEQVSGGIKREEGENFWKIPNRREAIRLALTLAGDGDTVVVAGKGAEEVIMLRGRRVPWNDRKVITELLERESKLRLS